MRPLSEEDARKLIHASCTAVTCNCAIDERNRLDNGVWVGPRVAAEIELRWYGADGMVAIERIAWEFYSSFPRYLGNYDPDRDGLTCDVWWLKRVERVHDESVRALIEGDGTGELLARDVAGFLCPEHGEHPHEGRTGKCLDCPACVVDVTPNPIYETSLNCNDCYDVAHDELDERERCDVHADESL